MTSTGATGEIRWSYMTAATFGPWRAEFDRTGGTLTARVVRVDAFRAAQQPLTLLLPFGRQVGRWPVVSLQIEGESLTVTVGPRSTAV